MKIILGILFVFGTLTAQVRTVGPEPGIDHLVLGPGLSYSQFGEIQRFPGGGNVFKNTTTPNLIKMCNVFLTGQKPGRQTLTLLPDSIVAQYMMHANYQGVTYPIIEGFGGVDYAINVGDLNYQNYLTQTYFPKILVPNGENAVNGLPTDNAHPLYVSLDNYAQAQDYGWFGVLANGAFLNQFSTDQIFWKVPFAQNATQWQTAVKSFFSAIKNHASYIRLGPHLGGMMDWSIFKSVFQDVPVMEFEWFPLSQITVASEYRRSQFYNMVQYGYWFANLAPPVFSGTAFPKDPPTRIVQWGVALDNGDMHSAVAYYAMMRGPNTFFDLSDGVGHYTLDPNLWLPVLAKLGKPIVANNPKVIRGVAPKAILQRNYPGGMVLFNFTGAPQTVALSGSWTNAFTGAKVTSVTIGNGKGDVVIGGYTASSVRGANLKGANAVVQ